MCYLQREFLKVFNMNSRIAKRATWSVKIQKYCICVQDFLNLHVMVHPLWIYCTGEWHLWHRKWSGRWSTLIEFSPPFLSCPQPLHCRSRILANTVLCVPGKLVYTKVNTQQLPAVFFTVPNRTGYNSLDLIHLYSPWQIASDRALSFAALTQN